MMLRPLPVRHAPILRHHLSLFVLAVATVAAMGLASPAHARGKARSRSTTKVGVATFLGPGEAASRAAAAKALSSKKIVVVNGAELAATAKQLHVRLEDDAGCKAVAKTLNLTALVTGEVSKKKAVLTVRTGSDGSVVGEEAFVGPDPKHVAGVIGRTFWKRLAGAFNKTNPPSGGGGGTIEASSNDDSATAAAEPESAPPAREKAGAAREEEASAEPDRKARKRDADAESESDADSKKVASSSKKANDDEGDGKGKGDESSSPSLPQGDTGLDVAVGFSDLMRSLSYNQLRNDLSSTKVANYSLPQSPTVVAKLDIFPGTLMGSEGILADLGLTADVAYLVPVVTSPGVGGSYKTASLAWAVGPKLRLPEGFFATVAYGDHWFKLVRSNAGMMPSGVPSTDYKFVRLGGGIRRRVTTDLTLMANLAYDHCLSAGQIGTSTFFPKATCAALELGAAAGYRITSNIELRAGVDLQRFGLAFHVTSADNNGTNPIAGGGIDQYIQLYAAVAYIMGGSSSSGGDAESPDGASGGDDAASKAKAGEKKKADDDDGDAGGDDDASDS